VPRLSTLFLLVALAGSLKVARKRIRVKRRQAGDDPDSDTLIT